MISLQVFPWIGAVRTRGPYGKIRGRPARFQTSNFIRPYNLHRLLLSGLGLLFRSLPIVLLDQS